MGRKGINKKNSNVASSSTKEESKVLSSQKRNEVNDAVKKLLKMTSQGPADKKTIWENHLEIVKLLQKINDIETFQNVTNREEHFGSLIEWIKLHGGIVENVTISKFENMEFGLQATRKLNKGDLICAVPQILMMTLNNVKDSPLKDLYNNDPILKSMGNIALTLFLILEFLKGTNSFWYPYISALPERYNTILYFTIDEMEELKCSPCFEPALKQCRNIARQYAYFYQVFQKSNDAASCMFRNKFTYQLYRWAVSTVMTRQNYIPSKDKQSSVNALIPLWDMCNHANGYLTTEFKHELSRSECSAFKSFEQGKQVLIFYGKRSNSDFLIHNGFVYPENEHDTFHIKLGISKADPLCQERTKLLYLLGIPKNGDFYIRCGPEPLDGSLLAFLRIFNMDEVNLKYWLNSDKAEDLRCMDCALDTAIDWKVWNFLYNRLKLILTGYSQKLKTDHKEISSRCRLVRMLCESEKKLIQSILDYVQERLNSL